MENSHQRRHVIFTGRVQGVFFRATTQRLARQLPLTGWVRNLPDGTVEAEIQGEPQVVTRLLRQINSEYEGSISEQDERELPLVSDELSFEIRG